MTEDARKRARKTTEQQATQGARPEELLRLPNLLNGYDFHPACALFPLLEEKELTELADDIKTNGLLNPIIVHKNMILDGRNRLIACERAGVEPRFTAWAGTGSSTSFVISVNLHRRHLNESQRAMVAARLKPMFEKEAKARQLAGLKQNQPSVQANLQRHGQARDQAAALYRTLGICVPMDEAESVAEYVAYLDQGDGPVLMPSDRARRSPTRNGGGDTHG